MHLFKHSNICQYYVTILRELHTEINYNYSLSTCSDFLSPESNLFFDSSVGYKGKYSTYPFGSCKRKSCFPWNKINTALFSLIIKINAFLSFRLIHLQVSKLAPDCEIEFNRFSHISTRLPSLFSLTMNINLVYVNWHHLGHKLLITAFSHNTNVFLFFFWSRFLTHFTIKTNYISALFISL